MIERHIILSAGGTGGHLFPAQALAYELKKCGWSVHLATDNRAKKYVNTFPTDSIHIIDSATPSGKNPFKLFTVARTLMRGVRQSRKLINEIKPSIVVGFGGYPTIPPLWAAVGVVPTLIHEQNAVMGRANKLLSSKVDKIAGGFLKSEGPLAHKIVETGNPVRPKVLAYSDSPYAAPGADGKIKLVIFGGSQGAHYFSKTLPDALETLPKSLLTRLEVTHQVRLEDDNLVRERYTNLGINFEIAPFFDNLPERISQAHLVIARAGASTVAEIAALGRPAILVPYPHALDHDQAANAAALQAQGGALVKRQDSLDSKTLSMLLLDLFGNSQKLSEMAVCAGRSGKPDAVKLLVELTETIALKHAK